MNSKQLKYVGKITHLSLYQLLICMLIYIFWLSSLDRPIKLNGMVWCVACTIYQKTSTQMLIPTQNLFIKSLIHPLICSVP